MKLITSLLLFSFLLNIFAGDEVGNGGDVIKCPQSIKLLDYYEASDYKFKVPDFSKNKDAFSIAAMMLKAFDKYDTKLSSQYIKRLSKMKDQIDFKAGIALTDIKDSKHEYLPKGCKILQIAIKRKKEKKGKLFIVSKDLWDQLSATHQAGLLIHEVIYEHFTYLSEKNSKKARFLNALIAHVSLGEKLEKAYKSYLQEHQISIYR